MSTPASGATPLGERFQRMVRSHYGDVARYVSYLTGFAPDAEDIVHEVFLLALNRLSEDGDALAEPQRWLRAAARNLVLRFWQKRRRLSAHAAQTLKDLADGADDAVEAAMRAEAALLLARCLSKLDEHDRRLMSDRYELGLSVTEIAARTHQNIATVRVRLFRIRNALRDCVKRQFAIRGAA